MKFKDGKTFSAHVRSKLHSGYITIVLVYAKEESSAEMVQCLFARNNYINVLEASKYSTVNITGCKFFNNTSSDNILGPVALFKSINPCEGKRNNVGQISL